MKVILILILYELVASLVLFAGMVAIDKLLDADTTDGIYGFTILAAMLWPVLALPYAAVVAATWYCRKTGE